ncbi:hypothetical protein [Paenibacillus sp. JMULE4]|uniref:hypothetical protein n=1 Tax=Paenibacillus TaxID=44249 RepID=UPI00157714C6|nr:hypothetical protein [Paenibacillus sp. JMULE4]
MWAWIVEQKYTVGIVLGVLFGVAARLAVLLLPQERNPEKARRVAMSSPILECAVRMPSEADRKDEWEGGSANNG